MPVRQLAAVVGQRPKNVAASAAGVYVGLYDSDLLLQVNPANAALRWQARTGPGGVNGLAVWGDYVVTANRNANLATIHRASDVQALAKLALGVLPWGVAAADGLAYVANFGDNSVSTVDLV